MGDMLCCWQCAHMLIHFMRVHEQIQLVRHRVSHLNGAYLECPKEKKVQLAVPEFAVQALKLPFLYWHFLISSFEPDFACLLCRIVSDCIPIKGRKRVPYLVIATVLSLVPWLILGLNATLRNSSWQLMTFLTVQNLGSAMADVVVDAMIAEAVRHEKYVQN